MGDSKREELKREAKELGDSDNGEEVYGGEPVSKSNNEDEENDIDDMEDVEGVRVG